MGPPVNGKFSMAKVEDKNAKLNDQQMRFVTEYLKDCNGKQAAIRAGYAPRSAEVHASRLLSLDKVKNEIKARQTELRKREESVSERIRRRLWEESEDYSEFASHSARIRALEILAKIYGEFELDNKQRTDPLAEAIRSLGGNVLGPVAAEDDEDDE